MSRRSFSTEFKRQAVHLVLSEGLPVQTVAMKLEIQPNSLVKLSSMKNMGNEPFQEKEVKSLFNRRKSSSLRMKIQSSMKNLNY